jgi:hypothetical protein
MARIIEFHISTGFTPTTKYVPPQERGALIVFPPQSDKVGIRRISSQQRNDSTG